MTSPTLYKNVRVCVVCGAEAPARVLPGERSPVVMLTITPLLYRRGSGKGTLKNARGVTVCEPCYVQAVTAGRLGWFHKSATLLWAALQQSLSDRYNAMLRDDL